MRRSMGVVAMAVTVVMMLAAAAWPACAQQQAPNVTAVLGSSGNFSVFLQLAGQLNLTATLQDLISNSNATATALVPLDSAFTTDIVAAYGMLSPANQTSLLLYHVLGAFYNRTQLLDLRNVSTLASPPNATTFRLLAFNDSSSSSSDTTNITTVFASASSAHVVRNISGIPDPPSPPIAIYPIDAVLLPVELFPTSSPSPSSSPSSSPSPSSPSPSSAAAAQPVFSLLLLLLLLLLPLLSTPSSL